MIDKDYLDFNGRKIGPGPYVSKEGDFFYVLESRGGFLFNLFLEKLSL